MTRSMTTRLATITVTMVAALAVLLASSAAASGAAAWRIGSTATPTNFAAADSANCVAKEACDTYTLLATNVGGNATDGSKITLADTLPPGLTVREITGVDWAQNVIGEPLECTVTPLQCTEERPVAPDDTLQVTIQVEVTGGPGTVINEATVAGGGAPTAATTEPTQVSNAMVPFGVRSLSFATTGLDGSPETQAGAHPYELTTAFELPSHMFPQRERSFVPVQQAKDVIVDLPPGFLGNPQATPKCSLTLLENAEFDFNSSSPTFGQFISKCPPGSRVGVVSIASGTIGGVYAGSLKLVTQTTSVFNLAPEGAHAAELGFRFIDHAIVMYADVVHTHAGYRVRVAIPGIPKIELLGASLTLFGQPATRGGEPSATAAFLSNPTRCSAQPLDTNIQVDSWEEAHRWVSTPGAPVAYPHVDGCNLLQFEPAIELQPETTHADTPSGYEIAVNVPRASVAWPVLASPQLKDATVLLPGGLSLSPSAADGLEGCEVSGPDGIDMPLGMPHPDEAGEGEAIGADGLSYLTPGHCPPKSQIGDLEVQTPLLAHPLKGHVYVAQPKCGGSGQAPCTEPDAEEGRMFGLYLEAEGSGVNIKIAGSVEVGGYGSHSQQTGLAPGQLRAKFLDNPQLPFERLKVNLNGGLRAPLANPQTCGISTALSDLTPWSTPATPDATPSSAIDVTGCAATMAFAPTFTAGSLSPVADGFSSFTLHVSRNDGEQNLGGITIHTPPGLLGKLSEVSRCGEPQASQGTCPAASRIGTTNVPAGAGSHPFWLSGQVYLTGPYKGAPFGLSVVVPAKAGPFNLGNEVVRAAVNVDRHTAALAVMTDPLPQIKDGVPFRLKSVDVTIDRPNFMFNPTNCAQQVITATVSGDLPDGSRGASVPVSTPFAVAGCKNLPFKPRFTVLTQAHTTKALGAYLHVKVTSGSGEANIGKVKVDLPKQLPSRLTTLQKACPDAVFNANPASCPAGSVVGSATAVTPVLKRPLTGPAYLVSHAAAAFPDLVIVLQGEGITLDLVGNTDIKKGVTISTFNSVPDAPISTFDLVLPQGPHSALGAIANLCRAALTMPTLITGQNGAVIRQTTRIAVSGCPRHKGKTRSTKRGRARRTTKANKR
jgi:hypothetical protein